MEPDRVPRRILPAIVASQLAGGALWFAVNGVMPDLSRDWQLPASAVGTLTSAVQGGFIAGTLVFALLAVADRFSPRLVFLLCSLAGAGCTGAAALLERQFELLVLLRFLTGFFLAGIYPVGMKIAAGWYREGLGSALGFLVGALVLGTASPHAMRAFASAGETASWQAVTLAVSIVAAAGGALMYLLVPDSARLPRAVRVNPAALKVIFSERAVRASAFGYFGHMWELYTMWVLVPAIVASRLASAQVSAASFAVIALGFVGCAAGGLAARRYGSARVAALQLGASGLCCLAAPLALAAPLWIFALWLALWGITVAGDSPQFSTLTANNAPRDSVGSVLTLVNCIGFSITIVSIQLFTWLSVHWPLAWVLPWLAPGPVLGLLALRPLWSARPAV